MLTFTLTLLILDPPPSHLKTENHSQILEFLADLSNNDVIEIGVGLGLKYVKLRDSSNPKNDMVCAWLREDDNVLTCSGHPSWESLRVVMEARGHTGIAARIAKEGKPTTSFSVHLYYKYFNFCSNEETVFK